MQAHADSLDFLPPPAPGLVRAVALAVLTHGLLIAALALALRWKHEPEVVTVEAQLWASLPQPAAPREVLPPPAPPVREAPPERPPQIATARATPASRPAAPPQARPPQPANRAQQEAMEKKLREEQIRRVAGLAQATGGPQSSGTQAQGAAPSASDAARIAAVIFANILYTDTPATNPVAEVELRISPTGAILSYRLTRPSGLTGWDDAVLAAMERTRLKGGIPPEVASRVPPVFPVGLRPRRD